MLSNLTTSLSCNGSEVNHRPLLSGWGPWVNVIKSGLLEYLGEQ